MVTFSELINQLSVEQVDDWWNSFAPASAPEKDERDNWKYWISKNGKKLPFKYSIRNLAEHFKFELEKFSSDDSSRSLFREKFGFEIEEELVFDSTERNRFIEFYSAFISDQEVFDTFLKYANEVVEQNGIKPYYIRMAINNSNEVIIVISMRVVLSYSEKKGKKQVGFYIPKERVEQVSKQFGEKSVYEFKRGDEKTFLTVSINSWNDVPDELLELCKSEIGSYYQQEKGGKLIRWNSEAKTSNSVLKYLVFNRESARNFTMEKEKTNDSQEFFSNETFRVLNETGGRKYEKTNTKDVETYNFLSKEYKKTEYWAKRVQQLLFPNGSVSILKKPTNLASKFDGYLWAKIYPTAEDEKLKLLAFTVGIDNDYHFNVKIDTVGGLDENDPVRREYLNYRGDFKNSQIVKRIHFQNEQVQNWSGLLSMSSEMIKKLKPHFAKLKEQLFEKPMQNMEQPLNTILYGPPGTGKTFCLRQEYFDRFTSRTSLTKDQFFLNKLKDFSWWQVIAAALLDLGKSKVSEIENHELVKYRTAISGAATVRNTLWGRLQAHTIDSCKNVNVAQKSTPLIFNKTTDSFWELVADLNEEAPEIVELLQEFKTYKPVTKEIRRYKFVTFHQSFGYEDFVEGIKPELTENSESSISYSVKSGVFKELCESALKDPDNKYALFIDEINRGNIASIFGELITLIEDDKRLGCKNEIKVVLPYSKKEFGVPPNLYIIGTMNTADRSVEALDTALRRRFSFREIMPRPELLKQDINGISLKQILELINLRIETLLDRDHTIGHSYFIHVKNEQQLKDAFKDKIIPLLQEYFYGDYGKIGLVLGPGFVDVNEKRKTNFPKFKYEGQEQFELAKYQLKSIDEKFEIIPALEQLLGKESISEGERAAQN